METTEPFVHLPETASSRPYLALLMRWLPVSLKYYNDWEQRPDCGHFFGGVYWYGQETAGPMEALAIAASSPEFDAGVAGITAKEARQIALKALRYLCFTHDTGPEDCLRPAKSWGRTEPANTKWGERGQGFFRESQCGHTVGCLARTAALLNDLLGPEEKNMLAAIAADYLERFGDMEPKNGVYADTQMEENAWTAEGLVASLMLLPDHPQWASLWEQTKLWMFRTCTMPQDIHNFALFADGKTVRELCGRTFTALPDGTAENHYIVHPSYMMSSVNFVGMIELLLKLYGREAPPHLYWHRQDMYDLLKNWADDTGALHAVQGMDWPYLNYHGVTFAHVVAAECLQDPEGALLESRSLAVLTQSMQAHAGHLVPESVVRHCHSIQDPALMSQRGGDSIARSYLLHRLYHNAPQAAASECFEVSRQKVFVYPHGGTLLHRHPKGKTSFSWRNQIMALPYTREGLRLTGSPMGAMLARLEVQERAPSSKQVLLRLREYDNRAAALLIEDIYQESVRRQVYFASLPDGRCLTIERLLALQDVTISQLRQGYLEVMNDPYFADSSDTAVSRTVYWQGGQRTLEGFAAADDTGDIFIDLDDSGWINVDDRFGLVFSGNGHATYHNRHYFPVWHAITDALTLNSITEPRDCAAGEEIARLVALWCPEESHHETAKRAIEVLALRDDLMAVRLGDVFCACNLSESPIATPELGLEYLEPFEPIAHSSKQ